MNEAAAEAEVAAQSREERFAFGKHQAYVTLFIAAIAALTSVAAVFVLIVTKQFTF